MESVFEPSEEACYAAVDAVYEYVTKVLNIDPQTLIAYGRSLGTGVTVDCAHRKPFKAVILQSPLVSFSSRL
jgi:dienelactone hydrolase